MKAPDWNTIDWKAIKKSHEEEKAQCKKIGEDLANFTDVQQAYIFKSYCQKMWKDPERDQKLEQASALAQFVDEDVQVLEHLMQFAEFAEFEYIEGEEE